MFGLARFRDSVPDTPPRSDPNVPVYDSDEPAVIVDVATLLTKPFVPVYRAPCPSVDNNRDDVNVDDAVENRPLVNPMTVDVEL